MYTKLIVALLRSENAKGLLKRRYAFPQISCIPKYSTNRKNETDTYNIELDKPIKFSTSKAARKPAGYASEEHRDRPSYQGEVISLSLFIFYVYFAWIREENDIDEKMIENIPIEILQQIYGKNVKKTIVNTAAN